MAQIQPYHITSKNQSYTGAPRFQALVSPPKSFQYQGYVDGWSKGCSDSGRDKDNCDSQMDASTQ